jgi:hypothetical protein
MEWPPDRDEYKRWRDSESMKGETYGPLTRLAEASSKKLAHRSP